MGCYTYLRNVTDLLSDGKRPYERRFGQPFKGPIIPFGSLVEYYPISTKDQSRIRLEKFVRRIVGVMYPTKSKQDLRVFWKLMNPEDCVWEKLYRNIMRTILQEKETLHCSIVHNMPQAIKIPAAKAAVDKGMGKIGKISAWNLTKVESKKKVSDEARTAGATVHVASLMDKCHLKEC